MRLDVYKALLDQAFSRLHGLVVLFLLNGPAHRNNVLAVPCGVAIVGLQAGESKCTKVD